MVTCAPGRRLPRLQGKPPAHGSLTTGEASRAGVGSVTTTSVAVDGPRLLATSVYVTCVPETAGGGPVVSIARSAWSVTFVVSVAVLFVRFGSTAPAGGSTVAVFTTAPATSGESVPLAVKTAVPPAGRSTNASIVPAPRVDWQTAPGDATQVHETAVRSTGNVSWIAAPVTGLRRRS